MKYKHTRLIRCISVCMSVIRICDCHVNYPGIEQVSQVLHLHENISITTIGSSTRVVVHLTNNYRDVKNALRKYS